MLPAAAAAVFFPLLMREEKRAAWKKGLYINASASSWRNKQRQT